MELSSLLPWLILSLGSTLLYVIYVTNPFHLTCGHLACRQPVSHYFSITRGVLLREIKKRQNSEYLWVKSWHVVWQYHHLNSPSGRQGFTRGSETCQYILQILCHCEFKLIRAVSLNLNLIIEYCIIWTGTMSGCRGSTGTRVCLGHIPISASCSMFHRLKTYLFQAGF